MSKQEITSIVIGITILANLVFGLTGIHAQVSCEVSQLTASAYAAFMPHTPK